MSLPITLEFTRTAENPAVSPFFADDFAGTQFNNANGFTWGTPNDTSVVTFDGFNAIRFRYGPDAPAEDSSAEQRFDLGINCPELWLEYDIHIPANFTHRNDSPQNNKFALFWRTIYSDVTNGTWRLGFEYTTNSGATPNSLMRAYSSRWDLNSQTDSGPNYSPTGQGDTFISASGPLIINEWNQVRIHLKAATDQTSSDGAQQMWINGVLVLSITNGRFWNYPTGTDPVDCYLRNGYFMGWANSGFLAETDFHIKAVKFYNTNPMW